MPAFSQSLEAALHRALEYANERHHEYATLEHLLLALLDDRDAAAVMKACLVNFDALRKRITEYLDNELSEPVRQGLHRSPAHHRLPARGASRGGARAVLRARGGHGRQRAGRHLRRAREPCRVLPAGAGDDALRGGPVHQPRHRQAARHVRAQARARRRRGPGRGRARGRQEAAAGRAQHLLRQPQQEGQGRPHRPADRARARGHAHHPGAVPAPEEQPAVRGRSGRRQDRDRRGPGAQDRQRRGARGAQDLDHLLARHGRAAGRHALPRRLRGAAQGRHEGDRELSRRASCSSTRSTP